MVNWKYLGTAAIFATALTAMGVGMYYVGYGAERPVDPKEETKGRIDISSMLLEEIKASNIDAYLKTLSSVPHLAGTKQDLEQANWIKDRFYEFGLDSASVSPYTVYLSYPDKNQPNKVYLLDSDGNANFTTNGKQEPIYSAEEDSPDVPFNFNAYSATGTVEGDLVYVYYGREEDYKVLEEAGINVAGKIVLARYGQVFRGNIVALAETKGAIGAVLYSDPKDFAQKGRNDVYNNSIWMPGKAAQLGTVYLGNGDPLTPNYPAIDSAYRIDRTKANLPKIPVQPIGYDEAERFLRAMDNSKLAPADWQGTLNVTYCMGGLQAAAWRVKLEVLTSNKMATIHNTIGILYGDEEPDRYVLVGNHRDAWILGATDPSSGTAAMLEMARAFGIMKQNYNWRPRRTLVFCSWGAEEYGLIGSYEWVEQHNKILSQRAVAYLNVDIAVEGTYSLYGSAAPLLRTVLSDSSKKIPNPNATEVASGHKSIYDTWVKSFPDSDNNQYPKIGALGSGSDYTAFMHTYGIPSLDVRYTYQEDIGSYPLYHTLYETHFLASKLTDPGFLYHRAVTQLWAEIARNLTESLILPFDVEWYATFLERELKGLETTYSDRLDLEGATFDYFRSAVTNFFTSTETFAENRRANKDITNTLAVRQLNDRLIQLERFFIDPRGLPDRTEFNHIVFAPSASDTYSSSTFSGLTDLLEMVKGQSEGQNSEAWAKIKQHLSVIAFYVEEAAKSLLC